MRFFVAALTELKCAFSSHALCATTLTSSEISVRTGMVLLVLGQLQIGIGHDWRAQTHSQRTVILQNTFSALPRVRLVWTHLLDAQHQHALDPPARGVAHWQHAVSNAESQPE